MNLRPPLIAIVDDEVSICRALRRVLRIADYRVDSFNSPLLFLDSLGDRMPDCVVLDLQMPVMTGVEVQQHLLQLAKPPSVIIITARDEPKTRDRCFALGAVHYLRKPIESETLIQAIREAVGAARTGRPPTRTSDED